MRSTSSFRRTGGLLAATTLGMSTAVLSMTGVAQAEPSGFAFSSAENTTVDIPAGTCAVQWTLIGGRGGADVDGVPAGPAAERRFTTTVSEGQQFTLVAGTSGADSLDGASGGTNAAYEGAFDGQAGNYNSDGGGGGGAASVVLEGEGVYLHAAGSAGAGVDGGAYGFVEASLTDTIVEDPDHDFNGVTESPDPEGLITGAGVACTDDGGAGGGETLAPPAAPTGLTVTAGNTQLTIGFEPTWSDGTTADPHTFEYRIGAGSWIEFEPEYGWNGPELTLTGLTNGTTYTVHLRGVSNEGVDGASASIAGTPYKPIGKPGNVQVSTSDSLVTFTWDAPTAPGTFALGGYVGVLAANYGESGGPVFYCENTVAERVCAAPAAPGINYEVFVTAVDTAGNAGVTAGPIAAGKVAPPATVPASAGPLQAPPGAAGGVGQGEKITLTGTGYAPNTLITILIYSEPQVLTSTWTDGTGSFSIEVTVPAGLPAGQHTLVAAGVDPSGAMRYLTLPVTVTESVAVLAYTGADIALPAFGGLAALAVGGGLMFAGRRRTTV